MAHYMQATVVTVTVGDGLRSQSSYLNELPTDLQLKSPAKYSASQFLVNLTCFMQFRIKTY